MSKTSISIICENRAGLPSGIIGEHGFSALIETEEEKVLLDTGQGLGIRRNIQTLGKDLSGLSCVVLSHGHYDHTGGLDQVLEMVLKTTVLAHPAIFEKKYAQSQEGTYTFIGMPLRRIHLEGRYGATFQFHREMFQISKHIWFSGEIPRKTDYEKQDSSLVKLEKNLYVPDPVQDDISLLVETDCGPVIVTGCAHAGIVNIMNHFSRQTGHNKFYAVIGGTHLGFNCSDVQLEMTMNAFDDFGLELVAVSHCTGNSAAAECYARFGSRFAFAQAGTVFEF